ncbi:MAG: hypothetical protein JWM99_118 [Verrucomicrobiales bacterium]|nr:hypothetical protein [Verrucomicrobiales bacterium]
MRRMGDFARRAKVISRSPELNRYSPSPLRPEAGNSRVVFDGQLDSVTIRERDPWGSRSKMNLLGLIGIAGSSVLMWQTTIRIPATEE